MVISKLTLKLKKMCHIKKMKKDIKNLNKIIYNYYMFNNKTRGRYRSIDEVKC